MPDSVLSLRNFGVAFGERVVIADISLEIPERGIFVLMGPVATGKSTLLRSLAGLSAALPTYNSRGTAIFAGRKLKKSKDKPALVMQKAKLLTSSILENLMAELPERSTLTNLQQRDLATRLLRRDGLESLVDRLDDDAIDLSVAEQRRLTVMRTAASGPRLLMVDEPTADLCDDDVGPMLDLLLSEAERRAVLVTTHNQMHARRLGGNIALIAGGRVQETGPTESFLENPQTPVGKEFVRTGSCAVPAPHSTPHELADELAPEIAAQISEPEQAISFVSHVQGPRGFYWLKPGVLGGTPRPGLISDLDQDLEALQRVGVTTLISLTERCVDDEDLHRWGFTGHTFFIPDMQAPDIPDALAQVAFVEQMIKGGEVIAVHCEAGLGRTGTMLAAQLIWEGSSALAALEAVRRIETRWVQSEEQVAFLGVFEDAVERAYDRQPIDADSVPAERGAA